MNVQRLRHAGRFTVGQQIRGYDFPPMLGRGDSYLEGTVLEANYMHPHGFACYRIKIENRVFGGKAETVEAGEEGYVPHEVALMEYEHRIIPLNQIWS